MQLYVIDDNKQLIGKTILDIKFFGYFLDEIFIVTDDGGIAIEKLYPSDDRDDVVTNTLREGEVASLLVNKKCFKSILLATGKINQEDIDKFTFGYRQKRQKALEVERIRQEQYEKEQYLMLKAKYESMEESQ